MTSPGSPMRPLNVGNVVSAGVSLYRSHFQLYFSIALIATLWLLLPLVALIPIPLLFIYGGGNYFLLLFLIPIWFLLLIYGGAKYLVNSVLISRLAFGELVSQPESVNTARSYVGPRMWQFVLAGIAMLLIYLGIYIAMYVFFLLTAGLLTVIGAAQKDPAIIAVMFLLGIILASVLLTAIFWFIVRFSIFDIPLAIEDNIGPLGTISRSWELTGGYVFRLFLVYTVAFLVTLPIAIIVQIITRILNQLAPKTSIDSFAPTILYFLLGYAIGLLINTLTLPFWQTIKAIIYYDLRTRREGLGLRLRGHTI